MGVWLVVSRPIAHFRYDGYPYSDGTGSLAHTYDGGLPDNPISHS